MYPLADLPVLLPTIPIPEFIDFSALTQHFNSALESLAESHFLQDAIWRDSLAMTGTFRTFYSASSVIGAWKDTSAIHKPRSFAFHGKPHVIRAGELAFVELQFTFETFGTPAFTVNGFLSVAPDQDGTWKIWMMKTVIGQLKGQPSVDKLEIVRGWSDGRLSHDEETNGAHTNGITTNGTTTNGVTTNGVTMNGVNTNGVTTNGVNTNGVTTNGVNTNGVTTNGVTTNGVTTNGVITNGITNGDTTHGFTTNGAERDFECVVIGGGQAGLSAGGRLKALGVSYVVMDQYEKVGDSWAKRYDSTRLHTVREFAHLPFERTFPSTYQEWLTKDDLARGFREWVEKFDINVWQSTTLLSGRWVSDQDMWELKIKRGDELSTLTCSYLVFAVGANARFPQAPTYENREAFAGDILHSGQYTNPEQWAGKHGVVVGSGNTAHDVADDMERAGLASVTMVQRSPTFVVPVDLYRETHDRLYNAAIPTDVADMMFFSGPAVMTKLMAAKVLHGKIRANPDRFDALEKSGFLLDRFADMAYIIFVRQGGHYMDVGTSGKIARGLIKMQTASMPVRWTEDGLDCANGDHLKADVVIFATGFVGNMRLLVAELLGNDVASQVADWWGLDEEGETLGAFKPSGHPAFWYHGGAIGQARYMSRFIALQIKAKCLGTPLPIYSDTPARNSSKKALRPT